MLRRFVLAALLVFVVVGFAGHLISAPGLGNHANAEASCAFHAGFLLPGFPVAHSGQPPAYAILPMQMDTAWNMAAKIPHPPTV